MTNINAALEIGTSRTVLAVGEGKPGERLKVTCHAEIPSTKIRKGQILDMKQATRSVQSVLRETEKHKDESGDSFAICNAFLVVSGQHVKADPFQGVAIVGGGKVSAADIDEAVRSAHSMPMPPERELLDVVEQAYTLDSLGGISSPKGMSGRTLKLDTLQIHADANRINDARTAAEGAHLELRDPLFAAVCAADATLDDRERRDGALVLDLGGGSTGYAAYCDGYLVAAGVIGVGGDHVSSDIAYAFQTTHAQAENLKTHEASAIVGLDREASERVSVPGFSPLMEAKTVSRRALDTVVNLRLKELLSIIRETMEARDLLHRMHAGVALTGGGAAMRGLDELAQRELGLPVRIGKPSNVDGLDDVANPASYAAVAGALLYAHSNYERKPLFGSLFKGLFR
jgi:cell division protein FtsA